MIIGGMVSIILYVTATSFSVFIVSLANDGTALIVYPIMAVLASVAELIAGIFGIRAYSVRKWALFALIFGCITVVLNIVVNLIALYLLHTPISTFVWILGLAVPVLFTVFTLPAIVKKAA